ncbi:MAG: hypothetical protein RMZ41_001165 [Nostoc sp. DedVER02]
MFSNTQCYVRLFFIQVRAIYVDNTEASQRSLLLDGIEALKSLLQTPLICKNENTQNIKVSDRSKS